MDRMTTIRLLPVLLAGVLMGVGGTQGAADDPATLEPVDDATITASVKTALVGDPEVQDRVIEVKTSNGTVSLVGFVDNEDQVDRVVRLVQSRDGVKDVKNDLHLRPR